MFLANGKLAATKTQLSKGDLFVYTACAWQRVLCSMIMHDTIWMLIKDYMIVVI